MWNDNNDVIMEIYDSVINEKNVLPCECPICHKKSVHVYMHRHDERHGSIWVWCEECKSYVHMSSIIPNWWENPDFIDEEQLCSEPEYLNSKAKEIDRWINKLIATSENDANVPQMTEERFSVKLKSGYQDIPAGAKGTLIIQNGVKSPNIIFIDNKGTSYEIQSTPTELLELFEEV